MSEDDERRMTELCAQWEAVKDVLATLYEAVVATVRAAWKFVCAWRQAFARIEWQAAHRVARTIGRHPDLVQMDGWMDRMYPGIP